MHFLSLPDHVLASIFLKLGSDGLNDIPICHHACPDPRHVVSDDARILASCSTRLHAIYRESVSTLQLYRRFSEASCGRILSRYPRIVTICFRSLTRALRTEPCSETPSNFPISLVAGTVKCLSLDSIQMPMRKLQTMLEGFTNLKMFFLQHCHLQLDHPSENYADDACSLSLERHASSLHFLSVSSNRIGLGDNKSFDMRWLALYSLSTLTEFNLGYINILGGAFRHLSNATRLEIMCLVEVSVTDEDVEAVLPHLPHLRKICLQSCQRLSWRILACLPQNLDTLNVSDTSVLKLPTGRTSVRDGGGTLKTLLASGVEDPRFEHLLELFAGDSINSIELESVFFESECTAQRDLFYLLNRATNLDALFLSPDSLPGLPESEFRAAIASATGLDTRSGDQFEKRR